MLATRGRAAAGLVLGQGVFRVRWATLAASGSLVVVSHGGNLGQVEGFPKPPC